MEPHLCQSAPGVAQARSRKLGDSGGNVSLVPPFPQKLVDWDLLAVAQELSKDPLQSTPMPQACSETFVVGVGAAKGEQLS